MKFTAIVACLLLITSESIASPFDTVTKTVNAWWNQHEQESINNQYDVSPTVTVTIKGKRGDVKIIGWDQPTLVVDAIKKGPINELKNITIDTVISGKENKKATISTHQKDSNNVSVPYTIMVPKKANIILELEEGTVRAKNLLGNFKGITHNGSMKLMSYGSVSAHAPRGRIKLKQRKLPDLGSIFLNAGYGIDLYLLPSINGQLTAKTLNGNIMSPGLYMTLDPLTTQLNKDFWRRIKKDIKATIGAGGPPITLEVTKGDILITGLT